MTETVEKRRDIMKWDLPGVLYMTVGTEGTEFYLQYQCLKTKRESFQSFSSAKEVTEKANQVYEAYRTIPAMIRKGI